MALEFRITIIAIGICCFLFAGGLFFFQPREFRRNGVLEWIAGQLLLGVYWVFMGLRGLIPDFLSILVANGCLSASYSCLYAAVRKFQHRPYRRDLFFLPVVATTLFFLFFWAYADNIFARSVYITFVSGMQTGFIALILLRDASFQVRRSQWFTGCMFALVAALWFIRFLELLISPGQRFNFPETNPFWQVVLILGCGVVTLLSIGALLMIRERSEEDLRQSEERHRRLFENSMMGISEELPDGRLIRANLAYAQMYGYSSPEYMLAEKPEIGQQSYANPEERKEVLRILSEKGFMEPREICMTRRDGTPFFVVMTAREMRGSDGRLLSFQTTHTDITDRKKAEEALRQSEENFRRSLDDSPLGVRIVTVEGETIFANQAILDTYGYDSVEELKTTPVKNRYTPQSYEAFKIRREKRKGGDDGPSEYEISIVRKNGEIRQLQVFRKEILWDGERQFQVIYQDITERKKTGEALGESEARCRSLFQNNHSVMLLIDPDNAAIVDANPAACAYYGWSHEELMKRRIDEINTLTGEEVSAEMRLASLEKRNHFFFKHRMAVGTIRDVEVYSGPIVLKGKSLLYSIVHDITERKKTEEALKRSEKKYRSLFEAESDAVLIVDEETADIIDANKSALQLYGYSYEEITALKAMDFSAEPEKTMITIRVHGKSYVPVRNHRKKDGTVFVVEIASNDYEFNGRRINVSIIRDITERKQAEEKLRTSRLQLRALAVRLQQIREYERIMIAREIHDEMGGGLTGLKMDLSWLSRKMSDVDLGEERVALMDKIHTSNALIDQMIHVVRRISTDLRPSVLDDLGLIAALEWQLSEFTSRTEIQHEFIKTFDYVYLEEDTSVAVFRIFQEAITNVMRHSRATKVVVVLLEGERSLFGDESLVLEIRDNGRGITEEEILNKDSLGLLGMKERVLTFGGELSICGEPGGGTALILKIPRKKEETS